MIEYVTLALLSGVVLLMSMHLAAERRERKEMMDRYQQIAMRGTVWEPSDYAVPPPEPMADPLAYTDPTSIAEVEGR